MKQWSVVHALLNQFIDVCETIGPYEIPQHLTPTLDWFAGNNSLDQLTGSDPSAVRQSVGSLPTSDTTSLDAITMRPAANGLCHRFLGELLYNVGSLALAAADSASEESKAAMSCVFRLLARMHNLGLISDKIYQFQPSNTHDQIFRPPGLHLLSSHIMTVLSDAAWLEHESELAKAATEAGEDPPFLPFPLEFRELGPEIWFELILWCCVEHGFAKQGALLVKAMHSRQGDNEWKVESWAPLAQALDVVQQTNIPTEQSWRRPDDNAPPDVFKGRNKPPFNGLGKRTISVEVVACLRDTLYDKAYNGVGFYGTSPSELLKLEAPMNKLLDPAGSNDDLRPTNMLTNWHITRMVESGCIEPNKDPVAFQRVLRSTQSVVPPWQPGFITPEEKLDKVTRSQLYDESAAISGLVEYNIKAFAHQRQASRSFHQFALLQNIVDASKAQHIQEFFEHMGSSEFADTKFLDDALSPNLKVPQSSLPGLSEGTMAGLIDLATSSRAYGFGNWLLFNDDGDGPSIPASSYGNQILAPALLRFATATKNAELCEKIIASLSMPLSVNTLKSLVNFHIALADWTRVRMTLNYMRDFRLKSWGFHNLTSMAAKVVKMDAALKKKHARGETVEKKEEENLSAAKDILLRFFSGEFNTSISKNRRVADFQGRVLRRLQQVLSSFPEPLAGLMEQVKFKRTSKSHQRMHYIPCVAFNDMLASVVGISGSKVGIELWTQWCQDLLNPTMLRQQEGGVARLLTYSEIDPRKGDPTFDPKWHDEVQRKAVIPDVNTIRIIAQAALREFALEQAATPRPASDDLQSPSPASTPFKNGYHLDVPKSLYKYVSKKGGKPPSSEAEAALDFCATMYLRARIPEDQIDADLPGHMDRLRGRGVLSTRLRAGDLYTARAAPKRVRDEAKELQNDPFMKSERVEASQE
ncbi:Eukaryotic translation initiation factor 3 subunit K [Penicillium atrosanguineum]|uniref:Eukaryotic translation initiation factor 3 subunit K n=1 Tax=Penicillium atrosanguineum TaxID=1132637 RepID=UPI00238FED88|nr:Eukaryotic translation initiation factor 3 subunit K [Penicillium atrosanguineum]KAJ5290388.1 Eukaryotic translation initiation factor 3 subunit K [Penicillium atrosanguineum]